MTIKQTITFNASAEAVYGALVSSDVFAAATNADANISPNVGGAFSCFAGQITGRNLELIPGARIVQAWRAGPWQEGVYSIVRFDVSESDNKTLLEMEHSAYPEGAEEHLEGGWQKMYWDPLKSYLDEK